MPRVGRRVVSKERGMSLDRSMSRKPAVDSCMDRGRFLDRSLTRQPTADSCREPWL